METRKLLRYMLFAVLGFALLYYTYRDIPLHELVELGREVKVQWVLLAMVAHLVNHFFRAVRWRLFVEVQGYEIGNGASFLAEMGGFGMNLVPPRMGEWVRCVVLKRLRRVPISKALGGVFVERMIDIFLFCCLGGVAAVLALYGNGKKVLDWEVGWRSVGGVVQGGMVAGGVVLVLGGVGLVLRRWHATLLQGMWDHVKAFGKEVWRAMRKIRKSRSSVVWSISLFIVFFHFMVEYLSFYAIDEIDVGWEGALYVFIMMNIGMSAPTPGGIGVYHVGVISTLKALGVEHKYAVLYATLTHTIQVFNACVVGGSCLVIAYVLPRKKRA